MESKRKLHPAIATLIVIVLIGIVTSVVIVVNNSKGSEPEITSTQPEITQTPTTPETPVTSTNTSGYEDGIYTAVASYVTPGGGETIHLTVTLVDGVITDSKIGASGNSEHAEEHQEEFESGYKELIIGKKVDEVHLSRVSGSSLTSNGFNSALNKIKEDAKV